MVIGWNKSFITELYSQNPADPIPVVEFVYETANDIIQSRAQSATGNNPDFRFGRFKIDEFSWTGFFERHRKFTGLNTFLEITERDIVQDSFTVVYKLIDRIFDPTGMF